MVGIYYAVNEDYPYYTFNGQNEHYRNRSIKRNLQKLEQISVEDMMALQNDNHSLKAEELLPVMLDSINIDEFSQMEMRVINLMRKWKFDFDKDSKEAVIFSLWWDELEQLAWDEFEQKDIALGRPEDQTLIQILVSNPHNPYLDIKETSEVEYANHLYRISFQRAIKRMIEWKDLDDPEFTLSNLKKTTLVHLARIGAFSATLSTGGDTDAINSIRNQGDGPSQRLVVELGKPVKAYGIYPGGQSGNPGSAYYDNFVEMWRDGKYFELLFLSGPSTEEEILFNQKLEPVSP